ncbi:MAG: twin-arginine translocase subunit TatC [Nevskiales bacterium]|nr:twin-arginine translocase subunit TatC [Nevskiales bacterium]
MGRPRHLRKKTPPNRLNRVSNSLGGDAPLLSHLLELRTRLIRAMLGVIVVFLPLAFFAQPIFSYLAGPLLAQMPAGTSMIATEVAAPFLTPFKLAMLLAVVIAMPWVLYQIWAFVAPGLYKSEQRLAVPLLLSSSLLFYLGIAFAYFVVFPLIFGFLVSVAPEGVAVMTDISRYLDFVIKLFLAFGAAFETPVAIVLMVWAGFTTPGALKQKRPYVLVAVFTLGMLLTPPDIVSQTLLALPAYILFEIGIIAAQILVPGSREVDAQRQAEKKQQDSG